MERTVKTEEDGKLDDQKSFESALRRERGRDMAMSEFPASLDIGTIARRFHRIKTVRLRSMNFTHRRIGGVTYLKLIYLWETWSMTRLIL
jgi:hypothetical protein